MQVQLFINNFINSKATTSNSGDHIEYFPTERGPVNAAVFLTLKGSSYSIYYTRNSHYSYRKVLNPFVTSVGTELKKQLTSFLVIYLVLIILLKLKIHG